MSVKLSVVLDLNGHVESATAVDGPERFYAQAVELEKRRIFRPVQDNHTNVRAHFTDFVTVAPKERWLEYVSLFPEHVDLSAFRITLERVCGMVSCQSYKVTIYGSGDVTLEGLDDAAVSGAAHAAIPPEDVQRLVEQVRASNMLNALDKYESRWTDAPGCTLTLDVNGQHKQVVDYIGTIVGMPTSISDLEAEVDRIAGTKGVDTFESPVLLHPIASQPLTQMIKEIPLPPGPVLQSSPVPKRSVRNNRRSSILLTLSTPRFRFHNRDKRLC